MFAWVLELLVDRGLLKGQRIGIDATTLEANAAMRSIVRRDTGASYNPVVPYAYRNHCNDAVCAVDMDYKFWVLIGAMVAPWSPNPGEKRYSASCRRR